MASDGTHSPESLSSSSMGEVWVSQFCDMIRNQYFCEVAEEFMEDEFNLTGLSALVPRYEEALELILDLEPVDPPPLNQLAAIEDAGELLYGLIHARYIITRQGLQVMAQKYDCRDFGTCPRVYCSNTGLLPMGRHDMPGFETVRLFCPCCRDLYMPGNARFLNIDGAYFGSSFPGMFLEMFPEVEQNCLMFRAEQYQLKVFGFRISEFSRAGPRMAFLRATPASVKRHELPAQEENNADQMQIGG